jgi:hypothetical protein
MNVKIEKFYTLERVSHEDIETIVGALEHYKKTFLREEDFNEPLLKELRDIIRKPINTTLSGSDEVRDILRRLRPFGQIMVPDEIFSGCSIRGISCFMMGKSKQLNISIWDSKVSFDHKEKSITAFYINKHCANLLKNFLFSMRHGAKTNDIYLDSNGYVSYEKKFVLKYTPCDKILTISKDNSDIVLSEIEQICLEEFLISHLEENQWPRKK